MRKLIFFLLCAAAWAQQPVNIKVGGSDPATVNAAGQNAASPANEILTGCQFNTTPTTVTTGNMSPCQIDALGDLKALLTDGTNPATIKAASTAAAATDHALVVAQAPNGGNPCQNPSATLQSAFGSTSGTTASQVIALSGSTKIYICAMTITGVSGTSPTFSLVYGTGTNCGTGQTVFIGAWTTTANTLYPFSYSVGLTPAGQALCFLDGGSSPVQRYTITYIQQ
jgi:hypothetical protein